MIPDRSGNLNPPAGEKEGKKAGEAIGDGDGGAAPGEPR